MALTGTTDEQRIWNYLTAQGLTECGTAALMGNLKAESNLSSTALERAHWKRLGYNDSTYTAAVDSGKYTAFSTDSAGYGLAQWTWETRKRALLNYARSRGRSIGDLEMQLEFLLKELKESYAVVYRMLTNSQSLLMVSNAVLMKFENPAKQDSSVQSLRASYGQAIYDRNAGKENRIMADVQTYSFETSKMLTAHFNTMEFRCKCGKAHSTQISTTLLSKLEELFKKLNCSKIIVTSGYRCPDHDKAVGGNGVGQHTKGNAADICCYGQDGQPISSKIVCCTAQDIGFTGIANITAAYQYTHVDVRPNGKWYGDETKGNSTVTSDFYGYFGVSKSGTNQQPCTDEPSDISTVDSTEAAKGFSKDFAGTYIVTATSLNVRAGAGTNKKIITTIPQGAAVRCYGYYTTVAGVDWLYIQTTYKSRTVTGYVTSEWVSKK